MYAISPVLSKVFEHCLLKQLQSFVVANDNQFGFRKGVGCSHARPIYTVRNIVDQCVSRGNLTVSISDVLLIFPKAFDKVNHNCSS